MKGKPRTKQGNADSPIRSLFYILLSMLVTFFLLVTNKSWIMTLLAARNIVPPDSSTPSTSTSTSTLSSPAITSNAGITTFVSSTDASIASTKDALPHSTAKPVPRTMVDAASSSSLHAHPSVPSSHTIASSSAVDTRSSTRGPSIIASEANSIRASSIHCPASVHEAYQRVPPTAGSSSTESPDQLLTWCQGKKRQHRVDVGRSWGSLTRQDQKEWDRRRCNELLTRGKLQTCDEQWGWAYFDTWRRNQKQVMSSSSTSAAFATNITCIVDYKTTSYCDLRNVRMDFSKMSDVGASRSFSSGFLSLYGERDREFGALPMYPGIAIESSIDEASETTTTTTKKGKGTENGPVCDVVETRPTFVLSNDDIFNLGHYINDVMGVWAMTVLSRRASTDSVLLNIDGLREGGPAGGPAHRLMVASRPDLHGPYAPSYFGTWFADVRTATDYGRRRTVCFRELHLFPLPGVPWFWNDWGRINDCSIVASSPLYQSFNVFLRQHVADSYRQQQLQEQDRKANGGKQVAVMLPNPPTDAVHIVIEVRKMNPAKRGAKTNSGRVIRNLPRLIAAMQSLSTPALPVRVTAADFATMSFPEQMALAHSASILISMHGAGTTHIFHMAVGQRHCCGLLELFPDRSVDLYTAEGYGNLARMLGLHHARLVGASGATTSQGTDVDVEEARRLVGELMTKVVETPTCLHEVP